MQIKKLAGIALAVAAAFATFSCRTQHSAQQPALEVGAQVQDIDAHEPPPDPAYPAIELELGAGDDVEEVVEAAVRGMVMDSLRTPEMPALLPPLLTFDKGIYVKGATNGWRLQRVRINYPDYPWAALINDNQPHVDSLVEHLWIECTELGASKWGIRVYKDDGSVWRFIVVRNVRSEHGFYGSARGDLTIEDAWFEQCGAQAVQVRHTLNRADPDWALPRVIRLERVTAIECGQPKGAGRAGFGISIKDQGPLSDVFLRTLFVRTIEQTDVRQSFDSFGGVCVEYCRTLDWRGGWVEMKNPDRPSIQLYDYARQQPRHTGPENIRMRGVHVRLGGNIAVRLGDGETIEISQCSGTGRILVYVWDAASGKWKLDNSQSRPITQGMRWRRVSFRHVPGGRSSLLQAA